MNFIKAVFFFSMGWCQFLRNIFSILSRNLFHKICSLYNKNLFFYSIKKSSRKRKKSQAKFQKSRKKSQEKNAKPKVAKNSQELQKVARSCDKIAGLATLEQTKKWVYKVRDLCIHGLLNPQPVGLIPAN